MMAAGMESLTMTEQESKTAYRLSEEKARQRLDELSTSEGTDDLQREIALVRMLVEEQINKPGERIGSVQLCVSLLQCLDRLQKTQLAIQLRKGDLLERETVLQLGQELSGMLAEELRGVPDGEAICDRIVGQMAQAIASANN
jgi:hypothetical protein